MINRITACSQKYFQKDNKDYHLLSSASIEMAVLMDKARK